MNQNFSKSKTLHESSKLEHLQWEKGGGGGGGGGKNFGPLQSLNFQQLSHFYYSSILDWG